jgi:Lrp/AsnC family transcriptional regulator for asnA, asnC and gidA
MPQIDEENSKPEKLDKKDLAILEILKTNSRETCQKIAKKVALSNDAVGYRIKRMENLGIIDRYVIDLNQAYLKHNEYFIFLGLLEDNTKKIEQFDKHLIQNPDVDEIIHYSDKWDTRINFIAEDISELDETITDISNRYSNIIIDYEILTYVKDLINKEKKENNIEKIKLDESDHRIINLLKENSRQSIVELAKKLSMNADTIMYRIKKIEQTGLIKKFTTITNINKLGYHFYTAMIIMKDFSDKEEKNIINFCANNQNILSAVKTIGRWNLLLDIKAKDQKEFQNIMQNLKSVLGNSLKDYDIIMGHKEIK